MTPTFPCLGNCGAVLWSRRQLAIHYRNNTDCYSASIVAQSAMQQEVLFSPAVNRQPVPTRVLSVIPESPAAELVAGQTETPVAPQGQRRRSVTLEDVDDNEAIAIDGDECSFEYLPNAGKVIGEGKSERIQEYENQLQNDEAPWAPFPSYKEWELAEWLVQSGVSQSNIDKLLKLQWVS